MLQNSWSIKLSESPRKITTALLPQPSFVFQGSSNQLLVYHKNETISLPVRKQVIKLCNLPSLKGEQCEQILLLTPYSLLCFNFLNNEQKFAIELENAYQMVLINRNIYIFCQDSLYCFNGQGQQVYVNHFTQTITSICKRQNIRLKTEAENQQIQDHSYQIFIGFGDMTLSRYQQQNLIYDYGKVVGTPASLISVGKGVMVGSKQGSIAYYQTKKSKWKAKSSHPVLKMMKYTVNQTEKILVMRVNGNLELRDWTNGGTISKIKCGEPAIDCFIIDFRKQNFQQIVCSLQSGLIKAYNIIESSQEKVMQQEMPMIGNTGNMIEILQNKRAELQFQIEKIKNSFKQNKQEIENQGPILSEDFTFQSQLQYSQGLILKIKTKNGYISSLTFQEPIMPVFIDRKQEVKYQFKEENQIAGTVTCQILVHSSFSATKYQVKTISIVLPKFWKWGLTGEVKHNIEGKLRFKMIQRNSRYLKWAKQCFLINISEKEQEKQECLSVMRLRFYNFYEKKDMELVFAQNQGYVQILCDCLKTMGDVFQDLVNYVGIKDLNTQLNLPGEKKKIKQDLETVEKLSQTKINISTQMAEATNMIKFLLVKGESARLVGSMNSFRKSYAEIMEQNRNLLAEIEKKNKNTKILGETMKSVGQFINKIANIRYGKPKTQIIAQCREAIKTKRFPQIIRLMDQGIEAQQ